MKTLMIVTGSLGTGGLERITCFIANHFIGKQWNVVVLTLLQKEQGNNTFQYLNEKVKVVPFCGENDPSKQKIKSIRIWKKMIKENIKTFRPDSILCMTFKIGSMVSLFAPKYSNRVTIREISDPKSKVRNRFVNFVTEVLCRNVKSIIFQTQHERNCFHKRIRNKGVVIPNPLSISVNRYGKFCEKKIFTLSRLLINQKRQDILIKGFELFHETHPDYVLEIYGRGEDKNIIQTLISKTKCPSNIVIKDPMPNIHNTIIDYRCFVMTSDFEGMSNALLECYSLGIPCLSSDWPGVEDIVTDETDGLLYKRQDYESFASKLARLSDDDELCKRITKAAIANSNRFDQKTIISKYCEVIENE